MKHGYRGKLEWEPSDTWEVVGVFIAMLILVIFFLYWNNEEKKERIAELEARGLATYDLKIKVPKGTDCKETVRNANRLIMDCSRTGKEEK